VVNLRIVALYILIVLVSGCQSIGPQKIDTDRTHYNDVIQKTNFEQILKNVVRLRYLEGSSYFQVTSVIASYSFASNMTGTISSNSAEEFAPPWSISPNVLYSDAPTISYAPVAGSEFLVSLENPINFDFFILLSRGGDHNFELLAKLMLARIGPLENSPSAINFSIHKKPNYESFYRFVAILQKMLEDQAATSSATHFAGRGGVIIQFKDKNSHDALLLKRMVNVPASSDSIIFMTEDGPVVLEPNGKNLKVQHLAQFDNLVRVQLRSINAILMFLSHGVQVPQKDKEDHLSTELVQKNNTFYNWNPVMKDIITIYSSDYNPELSENILAQTYVDHHWFYIKASDLQSKETFLLTLKLIDLVAAIPAETRAPGLTLPS
jgi:hypothetical protein